MSLAELQRRVARAVLAGEPGDLPALAATPVPLSAAFGVHRDTVHGALAGALRLSCPTMEPLVGEAFFDQLARGYVAAHPPARARLADYAADLPAFLDACLKVAKLPYLGDVARLDLAIGRALASPGEEVRRRIAIDRGVALSLAASLASVPLDYPADQIRAAIEAGDDQALGAIDLAASPRFLAVWRAGRQAVVRPLSAPAGRFLSSILAGASADQALAEVFARTPAADGLAAIQAEIFAAPFCRIIQTPAEEAIA